MGVIYRDCIVVEVGLLSREQLDIKPDGKGHFFSKESLMTS